MSIYTEIASYLEAQGIGTGGTNLFYGTFKEPYPDACVVFNIYGGVKDEPNLGDAGAAGQGRASRLTHPRIQFAARGVANDTDGPYAKAAAIRDAMLKLLNFTLSGTFYTSVDTINGPERMMTDNNFREIYIVNMELMKEPS
jgi:hypothetical protein